MTTEKEFYELGLNILKTEYNINSIGPSNIYDFIRGIFDSHGSMSTRSLMQKELNCSITVPISISKYILSKFTDLKFECNNHYLTFYEYNALDFLSKIYDSSDARFRKSENYNCYTNWVTFGIDNEIPTCKFMKKHINAIIPSKSRASDVGYDLTIIEVTKEFGDKTIMYDTGIIISPEFGYYTKIVPRSSITKSGYMLTNSTGIIDPTYRGTLKICLTKVDDSMPNLKLPCKIAQLIIDRSIHYKMEEVTSLEKLGVTSRGEGGFGSTDKKKK